MLEILYRNPSNKKRAVKCSLLAIVLITLLSLVVIFGTNSAFASNPVSEPGFETVNNWTFSRTIWSYSGAQESSWKTEGTYSYEIHYQAALGLLGAGSAQLYQDVDLTDVDRIIFDAQLDGWSLLLGNLVASVYIDDTQVWSKNVTTSATEYLDQSIDVTSYKGIKRLKFYLTNSAVLSLLPGGLFRFDNIRVSNTSTSVVIKGQDYSTDVTSITFPQGTPGSTVVNPSNNLGQVQTFGEAGVAKPVVTLVNTGSASYKIYYQISSFTNNIISSERYLLNTKGVRCTSADNITSQVVFDTLTDTGIIINPGTDNAIDLYLKIVLSNTAGKSGISTLTILAEKT